MSGTRRTHCPEGRILYRPGEVPKGLRTATQLRTMRRRPGEDQHPVATLLIRPRGRADYVPLYELDATVELPALPGRQHARWILARTCVRCATQAEAPLERWPDGTTRRVCAACIEAEARAGWQQRQNARRLASQAWAAEVLADPATVVVAVHLADLRHPHAIAARWPDGRAWQMDLPRQEYLDELAAHREALLPLAGSRPVVWEGLELRLLADRLVWVAWGAPLRARLKVLDRADTVQDRYSQWLGRRPAGRPYRYCRGSGHGDHEWESGLTANSAAEQIAQITRMLAQMAGDEHPDGPLACPALPETGAVACGAATVTTGGLCPAHTPPAEPDGPP